MLLLLERNNCNFLHQNRQDSDSQSFDGFYCATTTVSPKSLCLFAKLLMMASTDFYLEPQYLDKY